MDGIANCVYAPLRKILSIFVKDEWQSSDVHGDGKKHRYSLPQNICLRCLIKPKLRRRLLDKAETKLTEQLDILNVLQKLRDMQNLTQYLDNKHTHFFKMF